MAPAAKALPGFAAVWHLLVGQAETHMRLRWPDPTDRITALRAVSHADDAIRSAVPIAHANRVRVPNRRALEAGVAFQLSLQKLLGMNRNAARLERTKMSQREPQDVDQVMDLWVIYIDRYVDATAKFIRAALKSLVSQEVYEETKRDVDTWQKGKRKALADPRNEVAHANTNYIRGIDEEGLWEPMILHGFAGPDYLEEVAGQNADFTNSSFNKRQQSLKAVSARAIAESNLWCEKVTELFNC